MTAHTEPRDDDPVHEPSDEQIVEMSGNRAKLMAFLKRHPGRKYGRLELSLATSMHVTQVGQFCKAFIDAGFIQAEGERRTRKVWYEPTARSANAVVVADTPRPQRTHHAPRRPIGVEVVLPDGTTMIVGRNPHTGRFRVEIGE